MKRTLATLALVLASCTGPGRGWVEVDAVAPTVEALTPYTLAGIESSDLTPLQQAVLAQELEVLREMLAAAAAPQR